MRRVSLVYVLIPAILVAASGLAYYAIHTSREIERQRNVVQLETQKELGEEKILSIDNSISSAEDAVFRAFDPDNLPRLGDAIKDQPLQSVMILDSDLALVGGGGYTKSEEEGYLAGISTQVIPAIRIRLATEKATRGRIYLLIDGEDGLFGYRRIGGYVVVTEFDIIYLVGSLCPNYFPVKSNKTWQVVDDMGMVRCGRSFGAVPPDAVTELAFPDTLPPWRLRVALQQSLAKQPTVSRQTVLQGVLILLALTVILSGSAGLWITARRERRLSEMKSDFISNVSHELKTPLSIISMFGEMLATGRVKSEAKATEYAEIIRRESLRLSRLIDNVLDLAKIERGVEFYEFADAQDVGDVVARAIDISRPRLERASMALDLQIERGLPPARLDGNALTLAVLNLIDNAIKYAPEGKTIEAYVRAKNGGIELEVKDYGPGIPPEEQDHVFERFYRVRRGQKKPIRGSGIGLSLVQHIAHAHGGSIDVQCGEGYGASFRLWIPIEAGT